MNNPIKLTKRQEEVLAKLPEYPDDACLEGPDYRVALNLVKKGLVRITERSQRGLDVAWFARRGELQGNE